MFINNQKITKMKIICGKHFIKEFEKSIFNLSRDEIKEILDKKVELEDNELHIVVIDNGKVMDYIHIKGQD